MEDDDIEIDTGTVEPLSLHLQANTIIDDLKLS